MSQLPGRDSNPRPSGYEPDELPDCSTRRYMLCLHTFCYLYYIKNKCVLCATFIFTESSNLEGYYSLSGGTRIPSGADMLADTYRVPGNYACIDNTIASTLKNCPISKAFILKVDLSTGNAYPRQTFLQFNNGKVFTRVFDAFENKWAETFSNITNADIIHGNTDAFSVPANGEHRVTLNLSQYNVGTDYRLYATVRGSTWVNLGAIYCNNNQAIIDLRNLNSTAVNVTLWYTIIRK